MKKRQIAILGSTGSIGTQALEVIGQHPDRFEVYCLTANNRVELLAERDLDRNLVLYTLSKVGEFFGSLYFKVLLALSGAAVAVYLAFYFISLTRRRGSKKIRRRPY